MIRVRWRRPTGKRRWLDLGAHERQVQVFLLVLVVLLVFANLFSFHILFEAIHEEGRTHRTWAGRQAADLASEPALRVGEGPVLARLLRTLARRHSLQALILLDSQGRCLVSWPTLRCDAVDPIWERLSPRQQERARLGFPQQADQNEVPEASLLSTFVALRGGPLRILRVDRPQGRGPILARRARLFSYCYAAAVVISLSAVFLFSRWVTRPYRLLLSRAAERAGVRPDKTRGSDAEDLIAVFQTILERLQSQEAALARLRGAGGGLDQAVIDSMASGVLLAGRDGSVRRYNRAAARVLDLPEHAEAGQVTRRLAECPELAERLRQCVSQGTRVERGVLRLPRLGAPGERHLGVSVSPVRSASGEVEGALCLFSDLTEIRVLEDRAQARDNLAAVGELSAGIAHEFRNALLTIDGYARLVERQAGNEEARGHAQAIRREARETGQVVDEFLRFARPVRLARVRVDVRELVREATAEVAGDHPAVSWEVELPQEAVLAELDPGLLRPALQNLLRNAADAVAPRGRDGKVRVRLWADPGTAECALEVCDNGAGIDPGDLPHLFTPFFTTKERGSGLGLPLARKAVLAHDGEIGVESHLGNGSRFWVRLPLSEPEAAQPLPDPVLEGVGTGPGERS
ncbi:MAG: ATP-binding protein [Acidobacteriota bacterium]